jgi:hypothetical protein
LIKFGTSKLAIAQCLVADGTEFKVENTKIKKKSCPGMFKAISNLSTVTTYVGAIVTDKDVKRRTLILFDVGYQSGLAG